MKPRKTHRWDLARLRYDGSDWRCAECGTLREIRRSRTSCAITYFVNPTYTAAAALPHCRKVARV